MTLDNMIIVASKSRYALEIERHGSEEAAKKHFASTNTWDWITSSHASQQENLNFIKAAYKEVPLVTRSALTPELTASYKQFVFLGGDNHFTYCAQEILNQAKEEKHVVGVTLDPKKSVGKLLGYTTHTFIEAQEAFAKEEYAVQPWTTLQASVNGTAITPAVCDYFIGEQNRLYMSRQKIYLDGKEILSDKSSGILVTTGAGMLPGSWYDNVQEENVGFEKTQRAAMITLTEHKHSQPVVLRQGSMLVIDSYHDDKGILVPDSHLEHGGAFMIGSRAEVNISNSYLHVIKPKYFV